MYFGHAHLMVEMNEKFKKIFFVFTNFNTCTYV